MASSREILLAKIRGKEQMTTGEKLSLALMLAVPAMLAQLSTVLMSYIDASMVGSLGAGPSASIGLVSTSTWIFGGFCMATTYGFSVQVAHFIGNNDFKAARNVLRQGLVTCLLFSIVMCCIGLAIGNSLPVWLGGKGDICPDASAYFMIYAAFIPAMQLVFTGGAMLQASGNMKVPSVLNVVMCVLDVVFNYIFIFRLDMGVKGASLGTGLSELVTAILMLYFLTIRSKELNLLQDRGSFVPTGDSLRKAFGIVGPMWLQNIVMRGAHVMSTIIVAPLGNVAIAANIFAITAESFCYMPGYGLQEATTTLTGQSLGAKRKELASSFAKISILLGASIMTFLGVVMYFTSGFLMGMLSQDPDVVALGAKVLKIEAFAEMMYAVSMVAYGACVGAGDTLVPSLMNLLSMWCVRIGLALILTPRLGLQGYWIAMCVELNVRGLLFIFHMKKGRWMSKFSVAKT